MPGIGIEETTCANALIRKGVQGWEAETEERSDSKVGVGEKKRGKCGDDVQPLAATGCCDGVYVSCLHRHGRLRSRVSEHESTFIWRNTSLWNLTWMRERGAGPESPSRVQIRPQTHVQFNCNTIKLMDADRGAGRICRSKLAVQHNVNALKREEGGRTKQAQKTRQAEMKRERQGAEERHTDTVTEN